MKRLAGRLFVKIIVPFLIVLSLLLCYMRYRDGLFTSIYGFLALALLSGFIVGAYMVVAGGD